MTATTHATIMGHVQCLFCGRDPAYRYALTVQRGDVWERVVQPVCARCHTMLSVAGDKGRKLKAKGETWYLGHGVGLFDSGLGQRDSPDDAGGE